MTSARAFNAFRKMKSGTLGGQSRVATPVHSQNLINLTVPAPAPGEPTPLPLLCPCLIYSGPEVPDNSEAQSGITTDNQNFYGLYGTTAPWNEVGLFDFPDMSTNEVVYTTPAISGTYNKIRNVAVGPNDRVFIIEQEELSGSDQKHMLKEISVNGSNTSTILWQDTQLWTRLSGVPWLFLSQSLLYHPVTNCLYWLTRYETYTGSTQDLSEWFINEYDLDTNSHRIVDTATRVFLHPGDSGETIYDDGYYWQVTSDGCLWVTASGVDDDWAHARRYNVNGGGSSYTSIYPETYMEYMLTDPTDTTAILFNAADEGEVWRIAADGTISDYECQNVLPFWPLLVSQDFTEVYSGWWDGPDDQLYSWTGDCPSSPIEPCSTDVGTIYTADDFVIGSESLQAVMLGDKVFMTTAYPSALPGEVGEMVYSYDVDLDTLLAESFPATNGVFLPNSVPPVAAPWTGSAETEVHNINWSSPSEAILSGIQQTSSGGFMTENAGAWSMNADGATTLIYDGYPVLTTGVREVYIGVRHIGVVYAAVQRASTDDLVTLPGLVSKPVGYAAVGHPRSMVSDGTYIWCSLSSGSVNLVRWEPISDTVVTYTNPFGTSTAGYLTGLAYDSASGNLMAGWTNNPGTSGAIYKTNVSAGAPGGYSEFVINTSGPVNYVQWSSSMSRLFVTVSLSSSAPTYRHRWVEVCG